MLEVVSGRKIEGDAPYIVAENKAYNDKIRSLFNRNFAIDIQQGVLLISAGWVIKSHFDEAEGRACLGKKISFSGSSYVKIV